MIHTLLLSHGPLAQTLLDSARQIVGKEHAFDAPVRAICVDWGTNSDDVEALLIEALEDVPAADGVLILAGLHGATPAKTACRLGQPERIRVISGMNLAMVVRLTCSPPQHIEDPAELADWLVEKGRSGVRHEASLCEATKASS